MKIKEVLGENNVISFPTKRKLNKNVIDKNETYDISMSIDFLYHDDNDIDVIEGSISDAMALINQDLANEFDNKYELKMIGSGGGYGARDYSFEIEGISGNDIEQLALIQQWPQGFVMQIKYDRRLENIIIENVSIIMRDSESVVTKIDPIFRTKDGSPLDPSEV